MEETKFNSISNIKEKKFLNNDLKNAIELSLNSDNQDIISNLNNLTIYDEIDDSDLISSSSNLDLNKRDNFSDSCSIYTVSDTEDYQDFEYFEYNKPIDKKWPGDCPSESEILELSQNKNLEDIEKIQMITLLRFIKTDRPYNRLLDQYKKLKKKINPENYKFPIEAINWANEQRKKHPSGDGPYEEIYMENFKKKSCF